MRLSFLRRLAFLRRFALARLAVVIPALGLLASGAAGQTWQSYNYPQLAFSVSFPGTPQVEDTRLAITGDRVVPAHVYAVRRTDAEFTVTIADIGDPPAEESALIDHATRTLAAGGEVKVDIPHRINRVYGRQLSILQEDGSRTAAAVFDFNGRLYAIAGRALPGTDATADAIRFVQSLAFEGGGSNRPPAADRRAGCEARPGPAGGGEGRREDIRCRRQEAFAALTSSLDAGDLARARQAWSSLGQLRGPAGPGGPAAKALSELGQAIESGDLGAARQAFASLPQRRARTGNP